MIAQTCLVTVRQLAIFLGWVLSRKNNKNPRHKKRAVATTTDPSRANKRREEAGSRGLRDVILGR